MSDDRFDRLIGAVVGLVIGFFLVVFFSAIAVAFDALPSARFAPIIALSSMLGGAVVGYVYVAVWSRWRARSEGKD